MAVGVSAPVPRPRAAEVAAVIPASAPLAYVITRGHSVLGTGALMLMYYASTVVADLKDKRRRDENSSVETEVAGGLEQTVLDSFCFTLGVGWTFAEQLLPARRVETQPPPPTPASQFGRLRHGVARWIRARRPRRILAE